MLCDGKVQLPETSFLNLIEVLKNTDTLSLKKKIVKFVCFSKI